MKFLIPACFLAVANLQAEKAAGVCEIFRDLHRFDGKTIDVRGEFNKGLH